MWNSSHAPSTSRGRRKRFNPERVAVFGAGMLGILTVLILKDPAREVILIEPNDTRRDQARRLAGRASPDPGGTDEFGMV